MAEQSAYAPARRTQASADKVFRRCGDAPCCLSFILILAALACLLYFAMQQGDMGRYRGLVDSRGQFCGVSPGVVAKPLLYFCQDSLTGELSREERLCVAECIDSPADCPGIQRPQQYAAFKYAGLICMPEQRGLRNIVLQSFLSDPGVEAFLLAVAFYRAWPAVLFSASLAVPLAFLYMCLVSRVGRPCILAGVITSAVMGLVCAAVLMSVAAQGGADGIEETGDEETSFATGVLLMGLSVCALAASLFRLGNSPASASSSLRAAAECIWDSPSIAFEPFLHLWLETLVLPLVLGLLQLLTWTGSGGQSYSPLNLICIIFYVSVSLWLVEITHSLSRFATSYATQQWFFASYEEREQGKSPPRFATCKGYSLGLVYHLPTLVSGSLCLCLFRLPCKLLEMVDASMGDGADTGARAGAGDAEGDGEEGEEALALYPEGRAAQASILRRMTPRAFMDVAMNGRRFCAAGAFVTAATGSRQGQVWRVAAEEACGMGQGIIALAGGILTYALCAQGLFFGGDGIKGQRFGSNFCIPQPSVMGLLGALVCWLTAHPFLVLPSHVADNILFCSLVERQEQGLISSKTAEFTDFLLSRMAPCGARTGQLPEHAHARPAPGSSRLQPPATAAWLLEASGARV